MEDSRLTLVKCSQCVAERISGRNNIRKALAGTTWGNTTDDLQGGRKIDYQLRRTCLESKPTRHQLQKNKMYTERGSVDRHWLSQDVQYRSPTHIS